ncbi:MAG: hypothetical protein Q8R24_00405, partial [Legionellaceae bacterium]|nr:hypothetical protein [Legionellaceae bacterium]
LPLFSSVFDRYFYFISQHPCTTFHSFSLKMGWILPHTEHLHQISPAGSERVGTLPLCPPYVLPLWVYY